MEAVIDVSLPPGMKCVDCVHADACSKLLADSWSPDWVKCDFHPIRFKPNSAAIARVMWAEDNNENKEDLMGSTVFRNARRQQKRRESFLWDKLRTELKAYKAAGIPLAAVKMAGTRFSSGQPDLHLTVAGHSAWLEMKIDPNVVSVNQVASLRRMRQAGAFSAVISLATRRVTDEERAKGEIQPKEIIMVFPVYMHADNNLRVPESCVSDIVEEWSRIPTNVLERCFELPMVTGFGPKRQGKRLDLSSLLNHIVENATGKPGSFLPPDPSRDLEIEEG